MDEEDLIPAINVQHEMPTELSAEEFQKKLYSWFESRGIMSSLQTHLRKELIEALKETELGKTVSSCQKPTVSPKLQALNLLVAEFLLSQNYNYSVSVFVTEVPLINVFSEFSTGVCSKKEMKRWKFLEKDVYDILETLGIPSSTDEGRHISSTYFKGKLKVSNETIVCERRSLENLVELLISNNVNSDCVDAAIVLVEEIIVSERKRLKEESKEEYVKLQQNLEQAATKIQKEQSKKIEQIQNSLDLEKSRLEGEMVKHQKKLSDFQAEIHFHQNALKERWKKMLAKEKEMEERERYVKQKEVELKSLQDDLQVNKLTWEQKHLKIADLQRQLVNKVDDESASALNGEDGSSTIRGNEENVKSIKALQTEIAILKRLSNKQERKINKLTQNNAVHGRDLEIAHITIDRLSNGHRPEIFNAPPSRHVTYAGAGEEVFRPTTALEYAAYIDQDDSTRRLPQRRSAHSSSSSEEHTMGVLHEAKLRLQRLERESEDVDRRYRRFKETNQYPNWFDGCPGTSRESEGVMRSDEVRGEVTKNDSPSQLLLSKLLKGNNSTSSLGLKEFSNNDDESVASSGIVELLAAGTSGVSMSEFETTSDKTEEQVEERESNDGR